MSCIKKILELKGDKDFIKAPNNENVMVEGGGEYRGLDYLIVFVDYGHRCGYVAIDSSHKFYNLDAIYDSDLKYNWNLNVHGGITFYDHQPFIKNDCKDIWFGFDMAHCDDKQCLETIKKYWPKKDLSFQYELNKKYPLPCQVHRDFEYVEGECKRLIDQLV